MFKKNNIREKTKMIIFSIFKINKKCNKNVYKEKLLEKLIQFNKVMLITNKKWIINKTMIVINSKKQIIRAYKMKSY